MARTANKSRRARDLDPGFFTNEDLGECSPHARLLFAGLWCWADRRGRLEDRPKRLRAEILPYDAGVDGEALISELTARGFLERYEVNGMRVIQILNFERFQDPHPKETESVLPDRSGVVLGFTLDEPEDDLGSTKVPRRSASPSRPSSSLGLLEEARDARAEAPPIQAPGATPSRPAAATPRVAPLDVLGQARAAEYPALAAALDILDAAGLPLSWSRKADVNAPMNADAAKLGPTRAAEVIREAHAREPNPSAGWYRGDLHRAANGGTGPPRGRTKDVRTGRADPSPPEAFTKEGEHVFTP